MVPNWIANTSEDCIIIQNDLEELGEKDVKKEAWVQQW